jgi:hypothetical protein
MNLDTKEAIIILICLVVGIVIASGLIIHFGG